MRIQLNSLQRHILKVLTDHELGETGMWIEMYGEYFAGEAVTTTDKNAAIRAAFYDLEAQLEHGEME